uniref:ORF1 n=1 Tax=Spiraea yellow leafspot virus TaxID=157271 RepID=A0A8E7IM74_9VIRU|nr:ORF1 [Spiraea yellow leafspot virus]QVX19932.1 ORF1 [Spiraea yellow leafspot virus]
MRKHQAAEFEEEAKAWERSERAARSDFILRELRTYPRLECNQTFPSCVIPCYHFNTGGGTPSVHGTLSRTGESSYKVINSLYDLAVTQVHNQAVHQDCLTRLTQYLVYKINKTAKRSLATIPEHSPLQETRSAEISDLTTQIQSLKADLREIKSTQTYLKNGFTQLRESIQEILSRESEPKPIEAATAEIADQLKKQVKEVGRVLEETQRIAKSLLPE